MTLAQLAIACPQCGSYEVFYSCNPACCFNHVCNHCYTTFEPVTSRVGEFQGEIGPIPPALDPSGPTAACARCGGCHLFSVAEDGNPSGQLLCVCCKALLTLELTEIAPG